MKEEQYIKGFKVFNTDWTCSPRPGISKQYACPGRFQEDGEIEVCGHGMHFCKKPADCFGYYDFNPAYRVAEVVARGEVKEFGNKCCTNDLEIVKEISWQELLEIVNTGRGCTGYGNSGNDNSGHDNSGYGNSGNYNSGNRNSGDYNSGNGNSGDYNKCSFSNGCFNTEEPEIYLFNKPSEWTYRDWTRSDAYFILNVGIRCYLDSRNNTENMGTWWSTLDSHERDVIKAIPNFNAAIFKEITGIDVDADEMKI